MPSKSDKQARFMQAAAHNPKFAKEAGVPVSVAQEFVVSDRAAEGVADKKAKKQAAVKKPFARLRDK